MASKTYWEQLSPWFHKQLAEIKAGRIPTFESDDPEQEFENWLMKYHPDWWQHLIRLHEAQEARCS